MGKHNRKHEEHDESRDRSELSSEELERIAGGAGRQITGTEGDDELSSGIAIDVTMEGEGGDDTMSGSEGCDFMDGGAGDDLMGSGEGNDTLEGGSGDDNIGSSAGDNVMDGGEGDDVIDAGRGDDIMTGGSGADTFVFNPWDGSNTITDFNPTEDRLVFQGTHDPSLIDVTTQDGNTVITYGDTTITLVGVEMTPEQVYGCIVDDPDSLEEAPKASTDWF